MYEHTMWTSVPHAADSRQHFAIVAKRASTKINPRLPSRGFSASLLPPACLPIAAYCRT